VLAPRGFLLLALGFGLSRNDAEEGKEEKRRPPAWSGLRFSVAAALCAANLWFVGGDADATAKCSGAVLGAGKKNCHNIF
jgi:hypothetical protein